MSSLDSTGLAEQHARSVQLQLSLVPPAPTYQPFSPQLPQLSRWDVCLPAAHGILRFCQSTAGARTPWSWAARAEHAGAADQAAQGAAGLQLQAQSVCQQPSACGLDLCTLSLRAECEKADTCVNPWDLRLRNWLQWRVC